MHKVKSSESVGEEPILNNMKNKNEERSVFVYADNAATAPVMPQAVEALLPYLYEAWGNPSSLHAKGRAAKAAIRDARERISAIIGCEPDELYFTSGATESANIAIRGSARAMREAYGRRYIITTAIEHPAVYETCRGLEGEGYIVDYVGCNSSGIVSVRDIETALSAAHGSAALVTIMLANNEIGTIQPVEEAAAAARRAGALSFTDATQAVGAIPVDVKKLGVDMMCFSGHKFGAPKGVGGLYIKRGVPMARIIGGGEQESRVRPGTENVAGIVAMARALEVSVDLMRDVGRVRAMRDRLIKGLTDAIPGARLNGDPDMRLPGNVNVSFDGVSGESVAILLDMKGICVSTGSACAAGTPDPSRVLMSLGLSREEADSSVRITLSFANTDADVDYILKQLPPIVMRLRKLRTGNYDGQ